MVGIFRKYHQATRHEFSESIEPDHLQPFDEKVEYHQIDIGIVFGLFRYIKVNELSYPLIPWT
jgi:hypothetical protein